MNEIYGKFLPIGSIVLLKEGTKRVMITGFATLEKNVPDKIYDYCGCVYPEGQITFDEVCVFNHDQIEKVFFLGYSDEEGEKFHITLKEKLAEHASKSSN